MTSLIKVEWLKMKKYNAFWWIMGLTALSYPGINYIFYMVYDNITNQPTEASKLAKMASLCIPRCLAYGFIFLLLFSFHTLDCCDNVHHE